MVSKAFSLNNLEIIHNTITSAYLKSVDEKTF